MDDGESSDEAEHSDDAEDDGEHSDDVEDGTEGSSGFIFDTADQDFAKYGDMGEEGESEDDDEESDVDGELETNGQAKDGEFDGQDSDEDQGKCSKLKNFSLKSLIIVT